ncbi:hypothetical protein A0Z28_00705 [Campylobacter lari]|nr:hypothetical protein [Campylobacter lari]
MIRESCLYPKLLRGFEEQYSREWSQHRELAFVIKKSKTSGLTAEDTEKLNLFRKEICGFQKIVISSELLYDSLIDFDCILHCKNILKELGFKKIKIIIYLREPAELFQSICSQSIKNCYDQHVCFKLPEYSGILSHRCSYSKNLLNWKQVFGKENLIVRLFDKNELIEQNLLKDFISCLDINWNDRFVIPGKTNESLDVIGSEILSRINKKLPLIVSKKINFLRGNLLFYFEKYFSDSKIKITPPKNLYSYYMDYFEESNEWIRKEFFPHKERLFPKKDLTNYKENYELKEMKPEYWDKIADCIADIVSSKNQTIQDNLTQIQSLNQNIKLKEQTIQDNLTQIQSLNQNIKLKEQTIQDNLTQIQSLNQNIKLKEQTIQDNLTQIQLTSNQLLFYAKYGTAKNRIKNQLSYKLGQIMINSKTFLDYLIMPIVLLSIVVLYKREQKIYKQKIKKDSTLILPPLKQYPDYKESIELKNHLSYKLGQALIEANKTWYKGGYIRFLYYINKIKI